VESNLFARRLFAAFVALILAALGLMAVLALSVGSDAGAALLQRRLLLGAGLAAVLLVTAAWLLARALAEPLGRLRTAADAMASGEGGSSRAGRDLPLRARDEIGAVARAVARLAESAQASTEAVRTDRTRLRTVLAGMVEGVVAVDGEERVVVLNQAAARILRCPVEGAAGHRIWELTRVRPLSEALSEARRQGDVVTREARVVRDAREQILSLHASPLRDGDDRVSGAVAVLHDITDLRRLEEIRKEFVANVSHELKTPLTAISALVETLLDDEGMPRETRDRFLTKIRDQTARLSAMVRDLLNLSRIESSDGQPEFRRLDLRITIRTAAQTLQPESRNREVDLVLELPESPVQVRGEEESLHQLVGNLLENAVRYTPAGGRVTVRLGAAEEGVVLEVEDTGIGIEPRHHERIFERFYRVDKGRSRDVGGTGLGLSIVKHVALSHGGRVSLSSEPGEGTTFRVWLPAPSGASAA
jgi:two-component system phosphate regulon sensor histidine kinase PhoR